MVGQSGNFFTLRDIQDSVSNFSGDKLQSVEHWLREFEVSACTVGWDNLRKFIYGKQSLTRATTISFKSQHNIKNWLTLLQALKNEFEEYYQ